MVNRNSFSLGNARHFTSSFAHKSNLLFNYETSLEYVRACMQTPNWCSTFCSRTKTFQSNFKKSEVCFDWDQKVWRSQTAATTIGRELDSQMVTASDQTLDEEVLLEPSHKKSLPKRKRRRRKTGKEKNPLTRVRTNFFKFGIWKKCVYSI